MRNPGIIARIIEGEYINKYFIMHHKDQLEIFKGTGKVTGNVYNDMFQKELHFGNLIIEISKLKKIGHID